ncbi:hypothetical protein K505DRAFT_137033 [Melanomma pulvis-pyrius CBS 109.77]|uniref:Uncharacterized protein n=1 Tax=Melanomma pulvis-pyrius CBS 109.77 TaxID=1314802 RepID=A0A6A6WS28_9PLEO|nr:hypothetical protein K505DRAFT_137033 [Melanomma pulvis-pyrius CBS 109.77]
MQARTTVPLPPNPAPARVCASVFLSRFAAGRVSGGCRRALRRLQSCICFFLSLLSRLSVVSSGDLSAPTAEGLYEKNLWFGLVRCLLIGCFARGWRIGAIGLARTRAWRIGFDAI